MTNLPTVVDATLPARYERACVALEECHRIDECKDWADKAAALASYARQADDDTLQKFALRIQARAIRRCGELLQTFNKGVGAPAKNRVVDGPISQSAAGEDAGMSERQIKTAVRVANVPDDEFVLAIESDDPPTITKLAEMGTDKRPATVPAKFTEATHIIGVLRELATFSSEHDAAVVAAALYPHETVSVRKQIEVIRVWLSMFHSALEVADAETIQRGRSQS